MKKLHLILFIFIVTNLFAQQRGNINVNKIKEPPTTIISMAASPNPFSTKTQINFNSTKDQIIEFTVKNLLGKTVYLERVDAKEGPNSIQYSRNNLTQGMYIYSLQTESEIISKRLIIR
jgi:hypothetical protein